MHSLRLLFLALNFLGWSLLFFLGSSSVAPAAALPIAAPMVHSADFVSASNSSTPVAAQRLSPGTPAPSGKRDVLDSVEKLGETGSVLPPGIPLRRDINTVIGDINILNNYYQEMNQHASNFRSYLIYPHSTSHSPYAQVACQRHLLRLGRRTLNNSVQMRSRVSTLVFLASRRPLLSLVPTRDLLTTTRITT